MNGIYLLDTNAAIALLNGETAVEEILSQAEETFVPSVVLGELYYGARRSGRVAENLSRIEAFAAQRSVLVCDTETARQYGRIRQMLRIKGRPIPENDIWIAAIALQYFATLLTRDSHFGEVEGLLLEDW